MEYKELKVKLHGMVGFTEEQRKAMFEIFAILERVVNSPLFSDLVHNYEWTYTTGRWWWRRSIKQKGFKRNKGLTNRYIYKHFMSGKSKFDDTADYELDLFITLYYSNKGVIGYTYPSTFKTWINKKFFLRRLKTKEGWAKIIGNIVHEECHNLGYGHSRSHNSTRRHTVPYALGYIAEYAAKRIMKL